MGNEPLGLPKGSVRAILALSSVSLWAAIVVVAMFTGFEEVQNAAMNPPSIVGIIIGYYFGARINAKEEEKSP